jgi:hypothetical protein
MFLEKKIFFRHPEKILQKQEHKNFFVNILFLIFTQYSDTHII